MKVAIPSVFCFTLFSLLVGCQPIIKWEEIELLEGSAQISSNSSKVRHPEDNTEKWQAVGDYSEIEGFRVKSVISSDGVYRDAVVKYRDEFVFIADRVEFEGEGKCKVVGLKFFESKGVKISEEISSFDTAGSFPVLVGEFDIGKNTIQISGSKKFRARVDFSIFVSAKKFFISRNKNGVWGDVRWVQ